MSSRLRNSSRASGGNGHVVIGITRSYWGFSTLQPPLFRSGKLHLRLVLRDAPRFAKIRTCRRSQRRSTKLSPSLRLHLLCWAKPSNLKRQYLFLLQLTIWTDASHSRWGWGLGPQLRGLVGVQTPQCQRMLSSSCDHPENLSSPMFSPSTALRQHSSTSLDQSLRIKHKQATQHSRCSASVLVPSPPVVDQGQLHSRPSENLGGCPLQRLDDPVSYFAFRTSRCSYLFTHLGNAHLLAYGCPFSHHRAAVYDALTADWNRWSTIYLFLLPALVPVCLHKFVGHCIFVKNIFRYF